MENNFEDFDRGVAKLPNEQLPLIMGIIGGVLVISGCCCGIFGVVPALAVSIIGFISGSKSMKIYDSNPTLFDPKSYNNVKTGRMICLIALILAVLLFAANILMLVGVFAQPEFLQQYQETLKNMKKQ